MQIINVFATIRPHWKRKWQEPRVLAWRISRTVEPGELSSMGLHRVRHDWSDLVAAAACTIRLKKTCSEAWSLEQIKILRILTLKINEKSKFLLTCVLFIIVVQSLSSVWFFVTPWTTAHQASLPFTISLSLLKFMSIVSRMPSNHLILCHLLLILPSVFPSFRFFTSWVSSSHQVIKVLELQRHHQSFQWVFGVAFL